MLNGAKLQRLFTGDTENKAALGVVVFLGLLLSLTVVWQIIDLWNFAVQLKGQSQQLAKQQLTVIAAPRAQGAENLFGQPKKLSKERVNTQYSLLGIMMSTDPKRSKAIIQTPGETPKIYTVGEQVNGLKVKRVQKDRVILSGYDSEESLYISWNNRGQSSIGSESDYSDSEDSSTQTISEVPSENSTPPANVESTTEQVNQAIDNTVQTISNTTSPQIDQEQLSKIRERLKMFRDKGGMSGFGGRLGSGF